MPHWNNRVLYISGIGILLAATPGNKTRQRTPRVLHSSLCTPSEDVVEDGRNAGRKVLISITMTIMNSQNGLLFLQLEARTPIRDPITKTVSGGSLKTRLYV